MSARNVVRVGVIGTGPITELFADGVQEAGGVEIAAVYSRDPKRGATAAARLGAETAVSSFDELLAPGLVDAVYIASPNSVHLEQATRAIDAGKHVLVEKPAVGSGDEWRTLVRSAADQGVILMEAMRTAYDPGTAVVRDMLPEIGTVRQVSLRHISRSARYDLVLAGEQVNIFDPKMGGGALRDLGVYCVYAMTSLFGRPREVTNAFVEVASGADGAGSSLARYDHFVVSLDYSKITSSTLPSEISGEDGTLSVDHIASPRLVELQRRTGASERRVVDEPQHTLRGEIGRFSELIRQGGDAALDQGATADCLDVLQALEESSRIGRSITLS